MGLSVHHHVLSLLSWWLTVLKAARKDWLLQQSQHANTLFTLCKPEIPKFTQMLLATESQTLQATESQRLQHNTKKAWSANIQSKTWQIFFGHFHINTSGWRLRPNVCVYKLVFVQEGCVTLLLSTLLLFRLVYWFQWFRLLVGTFI